jgi:pyruvate dehydrogenase E2 component (dihydrolipoamide acetyltransferase)
MYGISNFSAVINTPQAGILAVGELKAKPVVTDSGEIEPRQLMGVTLACDHRILYGADGAQFLARVRQLLEEPLGLAL